MCHRHRERSHMSCSQTDNTHNLPAVVYSIRNRVDGDGIIYGVHAMLWIENKRSISLVGERIATISPLPLMPAACAWNQLSPVIVAKLPSRSRRRGRLPQNCSPKVTAQRCCSCGVPAPTAESNVYS